MVMIEKPFGVLSVSGKNGSQSLADAVAAAVPCDMSALGSDRMVVHRLNRDSSGVMVFAKTLEAVRGLNTVFRTRKIQRGYELLVCGHVKKNRGLIDLPLMRDYECPPYMRISTDEHQEALLDLSPDVVGKKILEMPKNSVTQFKVVEREELNGLPVTRLRIDYQSGRTHQLNCHLAAFGHPIVGDTMYGADGDALPNGGLADDELDYLVPNKVRASSDLQRELKEAADGQVFVHATSLEFRHPVTKEQVSVQSETPF